MEIQRRFTGPYICNPSTYDMVTGGSGIHRPLLHREFEASLSYMRPCLSDLSHPKKKNKPGMVAHVYNLSTWVSEAGALTQL